MKWVRNTDYHGSRSYAADEHGVTQFSLLSAWLGGLARRLISSLARPSSSEILLRDGRRNFTLLGAEKHGSLTRASDSPFPTQSQACGKAAKPSRLRHEN